MVEEFRANLNLVNKRLAEESHKGTSFDPEKRAVQEIEGFGQYVNEVYGNLKKYAKTQAQQEFLNSEMDRFQHGFASKYNDHLAAEGRTISSFITGGSNFPVSRAQKANVAEHKRYEEMIEYRDKAQAAILRELKKMSIEESGGELEVLKKKIADAIRNHEFMVKTNAIVRKKITDEQKIREIQALSPISEITVRKLLTPDYMGRIGFPAYALSNDTANIHRMEERLKELERKESTPSSDIVFEGGYIKDNATEDRVQIFFDKKPEQAMIDKMKGEGWHWSPSNGCWQRKRTDQAMWSAERILGIKISRERFVPVKIDPTRALYDAIQRGKGETVGVKTDKFISIIQKLDNLPLRQQEVNRAKLLLSSLPNLSLDELIALEKTVKRWGVTIPQIKDEIEDIYKEYLELRKSEKVPSAAILPVAPQPPVITPHLPPEEVHSRLQKVIDIMKIYRDKGATYEDLLAGLKGYYLEQSGYVMGSNLNAQKLIDDLKKSGYNNLRELWRKIIVQAPEREATALPTAPVLLLPAGRKEELVEPISSDFDRTLKAYSEGRGYELTLQDFIWADKYTIRGTARHIHGSEAEKQRRAEYALKNYNEEVGKKLHRMSVISALQRGIKVSDEVLKDYPDLVKKELPIAFPPVPIPEAKKYTTPRIFKKGTIARNNRTGEKFVLDTDVEALQEDKNAKIWRTNDAHGHWIYIDDQLPAPILTPAIPIEQAYIPRVGDLVRVKNTWGSLTTEDVLEVIDVNEELDAQLIKRMSPRETIKYGGTRATNLILVKPAPPRPAEEMMIVPNPETLTKDEYVKEKYKRLAQVLRQQGKNAIAERVEKGAREPETTFKYETSHRDQVVLALAQEKIVSPLVLKDYPDIVARIRKENEEIIAKERAERERLLTIERAEENELNAELDKLPPSLKRHAETEIYGTLHMPENHKDYRNRYVIALGKVRKIAFTHLPATPPQVTLAPQPPKDKFAEIQEQMQRDKEKLLGEHFQQTAWQMTSKEFINETLKINRYRESYEKDPTKMKWFTDSQTQKWRELVEKHGEIGKLPDKVIENYIQLFGEKALFSVFRGTKAKGIEEWRITERRIEYRLPISKLKEFATIIQNKYRLKNIYLGGSQSPISHHFPSKHSDIDFTSYRWDFVEYANYVHATPELLELYKECRQAHECLAEDKINGYKIHLWVEPIYSAPFKPIEEQILLTGQAPEPYEPQAPPAVKPIPAPASAPPPAPISIFDQTTQRIRTAHTLEELQVIRNEMNTLPLFANERVKMLELYNTRYSLLLSEKPFGVPIQRPATKPVFLGGITPQEQRKKAQQKLTTPPPRRLSEFGIKERVGLYYLSQRR